MKLQYLILFPILVFIFTIFAPNTSDADFLFSPSFNINFSTVNIGGGQLSSPSFGLGVTIGQTAQGQFGETGFIVKAGFQYIHPLDSFTFTISNLDINFGSLVPGTPSTGTTILSVTTGSAFGYAVKTIADHPLRIINGVTTIPNTTCDLATPCTITDAAVWADNARYGFGYNMAGDDVDTADFVNSTYFRPFPMQGVDTPAIVMSRPGVATDSSATSTYKVNVSGAQAAGTYQNNIQYIAIPAF
ncbi:MAG: hypothetical protein UW99_C0024G0003 [Candidatus Collierbacteria bacterium GW2011_GWC2_45_15]|uniref:Uncharacterized protein n=2 Tax=Candidatus Collieribacteriota TaxID=1752725 RepID=A0A0G1P5L7_9BACT|nr:MAG: hypothetical protein UW99_C0024G0003 [Candidatus Collierbacteria bacterium GW2011_GWC2_45_15]KKU28159.1 MAG: hypothetical protein UX41_C0039G0007 [Candidatus Collierbacteria bacterium GW2011_GWE1_46_18]